MKTKIINNTSVEVIDGDDPDAVFVYDLRWEKWLLVNAGHHDYFAGLTWGEFIRNTEGRNRMTFFQRRMDLGVL